MADSRLSRREKLNEEDEKNKKNNTESNSALLCIHTPSINWR
jgi:hypothetical protein